MPPTLQLADYLFCRLRQLGVGSIHGVPGDYNLTLLDHVEPAGMHWVGNTNELNAGYAADGYARIKGVGALITTFGVGELSAINSIAGAYAERAAVVHIVGTPPRATQDSRLQGHHTLNDGNYRRFAQIQSQVTVAQASLRDPRTCPDEIDRALLQCIQHSRPVYIEVPTDLVSALVSAERLSNEIKLPEIELPGHADEALDAALDKVYTAKQPVILIDGESRWLGIVDQIQRLSGSTNWPTWTTTFAKGLLSETLPNFHGIYRGRFDDPAVLRFMDEVDLVLCFGPHFSSTNSYGFTSIPKAHITVSFTDTELNVCGQVFRDLPAKQTLSRFLQRLDVSRARRYSIYPSLPHDRVTCLSDLDPHQVITQNEFWGIMAAFLRPGDIVLGETGTAGHGCRGLPLPLHTRLFAPVTWLSIGYMLPAAQGAALAQRELIAASRYHGIYNARTILFIGDGSFQMTAQELSTIIREGLSVVLVLINNGGYTIERCIHGRNQAYNDIASWRYLEAPRLFGAGDDVYRASLQTWGDLGKALTNEELGRGKGLRMVEVIMGREDAPRGPLTSYLEDQKGRDAVD